MLPSLVDTALHRQLLAALPADRAPRFVDAGATLEAQLVAALAEVRGLVDFPVDEELFVAAIAEVAQTPEEIAALALGDLVLARACARRHAGALRCFERTLGPELDRAIARSPGLGLSKPEFRQLVLVRLFVDDPPRAAKIGSYQGRGSLRGWLRVTAARLIVDLSRRRAEPASAGDDGHLLEILDDGRDTELDYLRHSHAPQLHAAIAAGVAALGVRQRNLLRQRYLHEVSVDALARLYDVHRSTLYVWLEQARVALMQRVRVELAAELPAEVLDSVLRMVDSQLALSMRRVLSSQLETEG